MMKPQKTQGIKLELYTGNGKGAPSTLNKAVLEYPIQLIQIQCKMMCVRVGSDQTPSSFHKESKSSTWQNKHRSCACNAVH